MIKEYINGLGEFEFFDGYLIGRINDGVNVGSNFVDALSELIHKHYHGNPFIYISDRINSYSLDPLATELFDAAPLCMLKARTIPNMK